MQLLGLDYQQFETLFNTQYKKGEYFSGALFRQLFSSASTEVSQIVNFRHHLEFAKKISSDFPLELPEPHVVKKDGETLKFLIKLKDGLETESVVIPMRKYKSLCVSSQVGCKRGCSFCETAQLGLLRNLSAEEIVMQIMVARFVLREPIRNLVFMGMGEPTDNLTEVIQAIRVMSDQRGLNIPTSGICISTVGNVVGINRLAEIIRSDRSENLGKVKLAISLNAPNDNIRSQLMPVNRINPMAELKKSMQAFPLGLAKNYFMIEYVLIAGVNDEFEHALELGEYLRDLSVMVNLIPYNPRLDSPYNSPSEERTKQFAAWVEAAGIKVRLRGTKGQGVMAACGQLGNRSLSKRVKVAETSSRVEI